MPSLTVYEKNSHFFSIFIFLDEWLEPHPYPGCNWFRTVAVFEGVLNRSVDPVWASVVLKVLKKKSQKEWFSGSIITRNTYDRNGFIVGFPNDFLQCYLIQYRFELSVVILAFCYLNGFVTEIQNDNFILVKILWI